MEESVVGSAVVVGRGARQPPVSPQLDGFTGQPGEEPKAGRGQVGKEQRTGRLF